ncbi:GIY-YIG nuclease family protein [Coleofasciculus sp. FACHB-501]|uniref:GIY-YIG nuclease family protein n=1 Tax=Cyanophyceae TaxID=3028117 RepID=UPI001686D4BC|nr:GIY-YIG nuclease family protein [Coleofasciculus sp. FACHB-501]MBD1836634.1 GIY-YIG nuclease family protein [Coleofasciculus sp. FACHB-501]
MPLEPNQLDLFNSAQLTSRKRRPDVLLMSADALVRWKAQIAAHQQCARESKPGKQVALFDLAPVHCDPDAIDPFSLRLCPTSFYRLPVDSPGEACIYFVLDNATGLVLYIGETCRSNKRWKGVHDCKRYIEKYQDLHYRHGLQTAVNMAFWWDAPALTKPRQQLESELIAKWKSPFNKENWERWGQPFG